MTIRVRLADWPPMEEAASSVRREVFIVEQGVPEALEWDEHDASSLHALAEDARGEVLGTARLLPDGHIGRMAVRRCWRGRGVGAALLGALVARARARGDTRIALSAQVSAIGFYERFGFVAEGPVFDDAGIPHRRMVLRRAPAR